MTCISHSIHIDTLFFYKRTIQGLSAFKKMIFISCLCLLQCVYVQCPQRPVEGTTSGGWSYRLCECWELNPDLLEEQPLLLTSKLPLQPLRLSFEKVAHGTQGSPVGH